MRGSRYPRFRARYSAQSYRVGKGKLYLFTVHRYGDFVACNRKRSCRSLTGRIFGIIFVFTLFVVLGGRGFYNNFSVFLKLENGLCSVRVVLVIANESERSFERFPCKKRLVERYFALFKGLFGKV